MINKDDFVMPPRNIDLPLNTEEEQLEAISSSPFFLSYIENPSEKVQLTAVKQSSFAIYYIKNPSEYIKLEAVKQHGRAVKCISNPSKEVQLEAIKQWPKILNHIKLWIKNPCQEVLDLLMIKDIIE